jgi:hypothetical protein
MAVKFCKQTMGEYRAYYQCERPAKWLSPDGRPLCGTHRQSVDKFYQRTKSEARCVPIAKDEIDVTGERIQPA